MGPKFVPMRYSFKDNLDTLLFALLGGAWILLYTRFSGLGISPDSINYLSTAEHIVAKKGFTQYDGQAFIMFPFCYPLFISVFVQLFGTDWLQIMPVVNALMFAALIYLGGVMYSLSDRNRIAKWMLLALLASSPTLIEIYSMLWSESLFAILTLIYVWFCGNYFKKQNYFSLIIWAILTAILFDTRFAGLSLVVTGVVLIALTHHYTIQKRIKHIIVYGSVSILIVIINLARNYIVSGTLTGIRQKGVTPLKDNLQYFGEVICTWLPFTKQTTTYAWIIAVLFLLFIIGIFSYRVFKGIEHNSFEKIAVGFTIFYSLLILTTATISKYETLNNRLLSPLYVSFIFTIAFYGLYYISKINHLILQWFVKLAFFVCFLLVMQNHIAAAKANYHEVKDWGIGGYSEPSWKASPLVDFIKKDTSITKSAIPVFSNGSHIIYLFTKKELPIVPERTHLNKVKAMMDLPSFYLIWFNEEDNKEVFTLSELLKARKVEKLQEFNDGAIYKLSRLGD